MIKLFEIEQVEGAKGTRRFQSQLFVGGDSADFILRDEQLMVWNGEAFKETDTPYEIVTDIKEMRTQKL